MGKANEQAKDKPSLLNRWLNGIEKVGNKLPHPISIFAILVLFVIVLSAVCEMAGVSATGELAYANEYDYIVVNDVAQKATSKVLTIMEAERYRAARTYFIINEICHAAHKEREI